MNRKSSRYRFIGLSILVMALACLCCDVALAQCEPIDSPASSQNESACSGIPVGKPCTFTDLSSETWPGTCDANNCCIDAPDKEGACTTDDYYDITMPGAGSGIIATLVTNISADIAPLQDEAMAGIMGNAGFIGACQAAIILYITFYAIAFMLGIVQLKLFDFFIRMVKLGAVVTIVNGHFAYYFDETFVKFFNEGQNAIISHVHGKGKGKDGGGDPVELGGSPFDSLDEAITILLSKKMLVVLLAELSTGWYGWFVVFLLVSAGYTFVKTLLQAVWVYVFALLMRTLLFGLAPLFFACALFSRTRQLFDGWLNQIVNTTLQPTFLLTFFGFFIQLILIGLNQLAGDYTVCWTEITADIGSPETRQWWRFAQDGIPLKTTYDHSLDNPIPFVLPLTMWILADLARRTNDVVLQVAKDIANVSTSFWDPERTFGRKPDPGANKPEGPRPGKETRPPTATPEPPIARNKAIEVAERMRQLMERKRT